MMKARVFAFLTGLMLTGMVLAAHHSISAEFDTSKRVTFTGSVKKVDWLNPHIYTHVEVKESDGRVVTYRVEGGAPNALYRRGIRPDSLKPGTIVTCTNCSRSKSPDSNAVNGNLTLQDGRPAMNATAGDNN
jgi:hypothetical protein